MSFRVLSRVFKSITNFLSQNVIAVIDLTEVVLYFAFSDNEIVKNEWKNLIFFPIKNVEKMVQKLMFIFHQQQFLIYKLQKCFWLWH